MTVARAKGDRGLADILFSRIVRSRGRCEFPDCRSTGPFDTAHLIGRSASGTRCLEDNAACLCRPHHRLVDNWWDEKRRLVDATVGEDRYRELKAIAGEHKFRPITSAGFWSAEVERLRERCRELGLSDRRTG